MGDIRVREFGTWRPQFGEKLGFWGSKFFFNWVWVWVYQGKDDGKSRWVLGCGLGQWD